MSTTRRAAARKPRAAGRKRRARAVAPGARTRRRRRIGITCYSHFGGSGVVATVARNGA